MPIQPFVCFIFNDISRFFNSMLNKKKLELFKNNKLTKRKMVSV